MAELVCFQIRIKDVFIYFSEKLPISQNTIVMDELVCFQIKIKDVFIYFSEKLPISQKLRYFRGSRFP